LDSATEFLLGKSAGTLMAGSYGDGETFARNFNLALESLAYRIRIGPLKKVHYSSKFNIAVKEARSFVERFVQDAIDRRIAIDKGQEKDIDEDDSYIFSHELCKRTLDKTEITDQLLNILLAGRDTTASLLSMIFFQLARHQDVWRKLRAEVELLNGRKPSFEQLKGMKYLNWVMNESRSPFPPLWIKNRSARFDRVHHSSSTVPHRSKKLAHGEQGHVLAFWRRARWHGTCIRGQRPRCGLRHVRHASTAGCFWTRRGDISTGKMGREPQAGLGVPAIQRRS
jgi:cytochrome P450